MWYELSNNLFYSDRDGKMLMINSCQCAPVIQEDSTWSDLSVFYHVQE